LLYRLPVGGGSKPTPSRTEGVSDGTIRGQKALGVSGGLAPELLQKSKNGIFGGCNPLKYRNTISGKSLKK
jgi:hypothetical protein